MDPDQTAQMRRLVWINAGRKPIMLVLSWYGSYIHLYLLHLSHVTANYENLPNFDNAKGIVKQKPCGFSSSQIKQGNS
jgi:hypothetical protein